MNHTAKLMVIFFILFFNLNTSAITPNLSNDTIKCKIEKIDLQPDIVREIIKSFSNGKFDSIVIFLDSNVDFYYVNKDGESISKYMTDYKALSELETFLQAFHYKQFKVMAGVNNLKERIIQVSVYFINENELNPDIIVSFIIGINQNITDIAIQ